MLRKSIWQRAFGRAIDMKQTVFKIKDGTGTPLTVTVKIGEGNLTWTETVNRMYELDNGNLDTVSNGDQVPMDVRFDFRWEVLKASTGDGATVEDALKKRGEAASWVSTDSGDCAVYAVDLELVYTPCTAIDKETYLFPDFRYEQLDHDLRGKTVSCTGKCNAVEPTVTRTAQT